MQISKELELLMFQRGYEIKAMQPTLDSPVKPSLTLGMIKMCVGAWGDMSLKARTWQEKTNKKGPNSKSIKAVSQLEKYLRQKRKGNKHRIGFELIGSKVDKQLKHVADKKKGKLQ